MLPYQLALRLELAPFQLHSSRGLPPEPVVVSTLRAAEQDLPRLAELVAFNVELGEQVWVVGDVY